MWSNRSRKAKNLEMLTAAGASFSSLESFTLMRDPFGYECLNVTQRVQVQSLDTLSQHSIVQNKSKRAHWTEFQQVIIWWKKD
jgi:hypothetical protein